MRRPYIYLMVSISTIAMLAGFWAGGVIRGIEQERSGVVQIQSGSTHQAVVLASLKSAAASINTVPIPVELSPEPTKTMAKPVVKPSTKASVKTSVKADSKPAKAKTEAIVVPAAVDGPAGIDGALWSGIRASWRKDVSSCAINQEIFQKASELTGVPAALLAGVAMVESRCKTVSGGWMQLLSVGNRTLDKSAATLGISRSALAYQSNPLHAVVTGGVYIRFLEDKEKSRLLGLIGYNMGWGALENITGGQLKNYSWLEPRLPRITRSWLPGLLASALKLEHIWAGVNPPASPGEAEAEALKSLLKI
jgi:hypothetical protein